MKEVNPLANTDWEILLKNEFQKSYYKNLIKCIDNERKKYNIFPSKEKVFAAFKFSSFSTTKVIILGQDPYHTKGQANGLCFSVPNGIKLPPSLNNILKELHSDIKIPITKNGNLENWANQGVLLLNSILTVRENAAKSHQNLGWEKFTDTVIAKLSEKKSGLIFLLWGGFAQKKLSLINTKKHYILKTSHPSPLSVYKGFVGCRHFSKTNTLLKKNNLTPINWK